MAKKSDNLKKKAGTRTAYSGVDTYRSSSPRGENYEVRDREKVRRAESQTDFDRIDRMTDADIERAIAQDPDAAPIITEEMVDRAVVRRGRGPQTKPTKQQVTLRLDEDVIDHFKSDGPGWQTRMNDAIRQAVSKTPRGNEMTKKQGTRDTYKYNLRVGRKIVHSGITNDLERREGEHQQRWPNAKITQVGRKTTEDAAREWEETRPKSETPPRKKT